MKNSVSNDVYNTAFGNIDNIKIMQDACKKYRTILEVDDINSCKMIGLWKALGEFDEKAGSKFTTFLYNVVRNECRKRLRQCGDKFSKSGFKAENCKQLDLVQIEDLINNLEYPLDKIIRLRYLSDMTLREIGVELGMNANSIKRKIQKAIQKMKKEWI